MILNRRLHISDPLNTPQNAPSLKDKLIADLTHRLTAETSTSSLWQPAPENKPQCAAYRCEADEIFYGGSAGSGKTDLLLGLAITAHKRSIIFRRLYSDLEAIVDRSREILQRTPAVFNGQRYRWRDIPGDRTLEFGAMKLEPDKEKYQGQPHDLKAFDEICHFTQSQYEFVIGWQRSVLQDQRVRVVVAGNPPGPGQPGIWVIERWGAWLNPLHENPAEPGEIRWYTMLDGEEIECENSEPFTHRGETITPKSRTFIPALLEDNPYLRDTGYRATLQNMPEPYRSQLLYGDFNASFQDDEWQVIPTAWVSAAIERRKDAVAPTEELTVIGVDIARGGKDETVLALRHGNWVHDLIRVQGQETPDGGIVAELVTAHHLGNAAINLDAVGIGASPYDILRQQGYPVNGINAAERSTVMDSSNQFGFINKRAEIWWRLRERLDPKTGDDIVLPNDHALIADLTAPRYKHTTRGIQIESKADIQKRLGRSTDCGDALAFAFYETAPPIRPFGTLYTISREDFLRRNNLI